MIILGLDPGTYNLGWAVLESTDGAVTKTAAGVLKHNSVLHVRVPYLWLKLTEIVATYEPDQVAIEDGFIGKNARTALVIGQAQGICMVAAQWHNQGAVRPVELYKPSTVKKAATSRGDASKEMVRLAIFKLYGLELEQDAADAMAVALCHWMKLDEGALPIVAEGQEFGRRS